MPLTCVIILVMVSGLFATSQSSSHVHKRSDDTNALEPVVDRLAMQVTELKARLDAMDHNVAFSAQFSSSHTTIQISSPFRFDQVTLNIGNAYNPQLGVFTAPVSGVYLFSLQIFNSKPQRPLVDIRVNGNPVHRMAVDTTDLTNSFNGEDSDSMTVILNLAEGDKVWVESLTDQVTFWGGFHTFFTGSLLRAG